MHIRLPGRAYVARSSIKGDCSTQDNSLQWKKDITVPPDIMGPQNFLISNDFPCSSRLVPDILCRTASNFSAIVLSIGICKYFWHFEI